MPQFSPEFFLVILTSNLKALTFLVVLNQTIILPAILRTKLARFSILFI